MKKPSLPRVTVAPYLFIASRVSAAFAGLMVLALPGLVNAASATWLANPSNNNWIAAATTNNWSTGDGTFPGTASSSGNSDVATFNNASTITTIVNGAGFSIGGIQFDTANAAAYTINTSGGTWRINNGNNGFIRVTATVVNPQVVNGALRMASSGTDTITSDSTTPTATLSIPGGFSVNNSGNGGTLVLAGQNIGNNIMGPYTEQTPASILGNLVKNGTGMWIMTGNNTYHSNTTINAGILMMIGANPIPNSTNIWINSGTLAISNSMVNPNNMVVTNSGTLLLTNTFVRTPLTIGTLTSSNSTFRVGVNAATPFTNIVVTTALNLGANVTISVDQLASVTAPTTFNLISYVGADPDPASISVTAAPGYLAGPPTVDTANKLVQVLITPTAAPVALAWQGNPSSDWDTTTANWTNSAGSAVTYNQGDLVTFDDTAIVTAVNLTTTLSPGAFTNNTAGTYTLGGPGRISGATSLVKQGNGTLIFTNAGANNFNGGITISSGTLQNGNGTTLGSLPSGSIVNNGTLIFDHSDSISSGSTISGSGTLLQIGNGPLTLSGANTFTGGLVVNAGTVRASAATAPGAGVVSVNSGGTFVVGAAITNSLTVSNGILGTSLTGGFTMATNSGLTIAANSTNVIYSADPQSPTTSFQFLVDGVLHGSGTILCVNAPTNAPDSGQGVRFRNTNGISDFSGTIIYTNGNKGELLAMSPAGTPFSPIGTGKLVVYCGLYDGANTTTGPINGGFSELNLRINGNNPVVVGNDVVLAGQGGAVINVLSSNGATMGTLTMGGGQELIGYKGAGTTPTNTAIFTSVTLTGGTATFSPHSSTFGPANQSGTDFSLGNISQTAPSGITMNGKGNLTLTGNNTYSGNTTISNGVLFLSNAASIATSPNIVMAGGAKFDVSQLVSTFVLGAAQTLSNITSTAVINGNADATAGTLSLTYAVSTPSFNVTGGSLTVGSGTAFKVNNTGAALTKGSYKVISGSVVGTAPSSVTVGGNGLATAVTPALQINSGELFLVVPDSAPVIARIVTNATSAGITWKIAISDLSASAGWSDPDSDAVTLSSVGPTSNLGNSVTTDGTFVFYNAPASGEDFFTYTVTDGSLTANGTVYLEAAQSAPAPATASQIVKDGNGVPTITFAGIPGRTNVVEASTNLTDWTAISTNIAGTNGLWQVMDPQATNFVNRFYRSYQPYP